METIERCLRSLKLHSSDSGKLAVLMVLSKVNEDVNIEEDITLRLYEEISPAFLTRLLKASPTESTGNTFSVIGIKTLSFFVRRKPDIIFKNEKGEELLDQILDIFDPLLKSEKRQFYEDVIDIFLTIVTIEEGSLYLRRKKIFSLLRHVILEEETQVVGKIISLFRSLLLCDEGLNGDFINCLSAVSERFMSNQELNKFRYLNIVSKLTEMIVDCSFEIDSSEAGVITILCNLSKACRDIMQSHLKAEVKKTVITLICTVMKVFGKNWIFDEKFVKSVTNFIVLLLTVISVELDFLFHSDTSMKEINNEQLFVESSFFISQTILSYICSDSFESHPLAIDCKFISNIFRCFKNIMSTVYDVLLKHGQVITSAFQSRILISMLSMLSIWVTEETENLREELIKVLPLLMKIIKKDLENVVQGNQSPLYLNLLAPAILQIIPEKKMRKILISNECHVSYVQYLSYVLSSIDSFSSNTAQLEALFHMVHQFTILEPKVCLESTILKELSNTLLTLLPNILRDCSISCYFCLEIIVVSLTLVRMYEMECTKSLEQVFKASVEVVYKHSINVEENVMEIWLIAVDNITSCVCKHKQLVKSLETVTYLKTWSTQVGITEHQKKAINNLVNIMKVP